MVAEIYYLVKVPKGSVVDCEGVDMMLRKSLHVQITDDRYDHFFGEEVAQEDEDKPSESI